MGEEKQEKNFQLLQRKIDGILTLTTTASQKQTLETMGNSTQNKQEQYSHNASKFQAIRLEKFEIRGVMCIVR